MPATGWTAPPGHNASGECWQLLGDVTGFELIHPQLVRDYHQLTVDTYGAQHADGSSIRVFFSLVGLHLALDQRRSGIEVRAAHQRLGQRHKDWPRFARPVQVGDVTVLVVAAAGARIDSVAGHGHLARTWAESVWRAWSHTHDEVAVLTRQFLR